MHRSSTPDRRRLTRRVFLLRFTFFVAPVIYPPQLLDRPDYFTAKASSSSFWPSDTFLA
jgi:hypothetical protein